MIRTPVGKRLYQIDLLRRTIRAGMREEIEAETVYGPLDPNSPASASAPGEGA